MTESNRNSPAAPSVYAKDLAIQQLETAKSPYPSIEPIAQTLEWLSPLLYAVDPDVGDIAMCRVANAVFRKLDGDADGLTLLDYWIKKGDGHHTRAEIESMWSTLQLARDNSSQVENALNAAADNGGGATANDDAVDAQLPPVDTGTVAGEPQPTRIARAATNALDQYKLNGQLEEIERRAIAQKPILGKLALMGQATMLYAAPNTGKTLISFALAIDGIKAGLIDPAKLYYINNDDTTIGLAEKLRIAEEYGFNMLAEAYKNFDAGDLLEILIHLIDHDQAQGVIVIVDTATKVVNVLDATKTRAFTKVIRKFVLKGGTLIALAHANKNPGADGKPVYRGTTDVINDFDCVYVLSQLQVDAGEKVVEFENKKRRGDVPRTAAFSYSNESGLSYHELLASVKEVDASKLDEFKQIETMQTDAELVSVVQMHIANGITSKMRLADAVAETAGVSKRVAIRIIERYTGDDPVLHRWQFSVQERGAKVYSLLGASSQSTDSKGSSD
ncbi:MAG: hypothetical protein NTY05_14315 [Rhodocyclales bacterium]|nr:hypothetical protein [Rhodocyclales bacterium]